MRCEEFTTVMMRQTGPGQVSVMEGKVMINLDSIQALSPAVIPSELSGPNGTPVATQACNVFLAGGQIIVKESYDTMCDLWGSKTSITVNPKEIN